MDADDLRDYDELAADAGDALWPCTVVLDGATLAASSPQPRVSGALIEGSEEMLGDLVVRIRKSVLTTEPPVDVVLAAHGREWWVREVRGKNAADAAWALRCEPKN